MDKRTKASRLSLDLLKGFEAAARHLSFTRAAQELFLTLSAMQSTSRSVPVSPAAYCALLVARRQHRRAHRKFQPISQIMPKEPERKARYMLR